MSALVLSMDGGGGKRGVIVFADLGWSNFERPRRSITVDVSGDMPFEVINRHIRRFSVDSCLYDLCVYC